MTRDRLADVAICAAALDAERPGAALKERYEWVPLPGLKQIPMFRLWRRKTYREDGP